jgi:hypothetical protein
VSTDYRDGERICLLCGTISLNEVCAACDPYSVYDQPTGNTTWWDHPDADPIADMRSFMKRLRSTPQVIQPTLVPEWIQRRYGVDQYGHPRQQSAGGST